MKIVTHNAKFHSDDVFGVATLFLLLGKENCELVRTRDGDVVESGDYVLDVGNTYDPLRRRFDHHQIGGAGKRENGIEYASFGLIWKEFGEKVCGSKEVAEKLENTLVQFIDATDNGQDISKPVIPNVLPFTVNRVIDSFRPTWKEVEDWDKSFMVAVQWAQDLLKREIKIVADQVEGAKIVEEAYGQSTDKKVIQVDERYDVGRETVMGVLVDYPEPIYAILYRGDTKSWQVLAIRKDSTSFESRKALPLNWRGKRDKEFEAESGVPGVLFCHRSGFMCTVQTKEGALKLAEIALNF